MIRTRSRKSLRLADGRRLSFLETGAPSGAPVMYFHGSPSAASECRLLGSREKVAATGLRLIAIDRPGSAGSTFQAGRRILDWPADVTAVADHLRLDRFAVLGYSGGGPYALACARRLAERLTAVVTISGTAPFDVPGATDGISPDAWRFIQLARTRPWLSRAISRFMGLTARFAPGRMSEQAIRSMPDVDAAVLGDPEIAEAFVRIVYETTHGSARGAQHDTALMISQWGFDPAEIAAPVTMWHGTEDRNAPPGMARWLANRLPGADLRWLAGEGHISAAATHAERILRELRQVMRVER